MNVILTTETLYNDQLETPLVWEQIVKAEEMREDGTRRLLELDDETDAVAYQVALDQIMAPQD